MCVAGYLRGVNQLWRAYGAPIELFSVDPLNGTKTELANTSITNLLAELPVLETQANGANLGLQLADGTQVQFGSTARAATFLYSLAVQQMQATSFVTDNYNLDMQWLSTVDQPLLDEADYWSERAAAEASVYPERTIEDNTQASPGAAHRGGGAVQPAGHVRDDPQRADRRSRGARGATESAARTKLRRLAHEH